MELLVDVLLALVGLAVIAGTGLSAIRTIVLPRAARSLLTLWVFRIVRRGFLLVSRGGTFERRDRVLALFTPVALLVLAGVWVISFIVGFAFLFGAAGAASPSLALWEAGSSLVTLGSAPLDSGLQRTIGVTAATVGLGVVALLIAFLPSLYGAFSSREAMVALLETEAGSPPSPVEMLVRLHRIGMIDRLASEWQAWQRWFVDLDESHTSYPALVWLRSPVIDRSWVTAAATVLDAAALWVAVVDAPRDPRAALCIRTGYLALRRVAGFFLISFDPEPAPDDPISITREQFDLAVEEMVEAGIEVYDDLDRAWADFAGWRVNYDAALVGLARLIQPHPSRWVTAD